MRTSGADLVQRHDYSKEFFFLPDPLLPTGVPVVPFLTDLIRAARTRFAPAAALTVALLVPAGPLAAQVATVEESVARAEAFMITCAARFPETRETTAVLQSEGWRFEGTTGNFRYYSENGRRVLAATATTGNRSQGCIAAVSRLSEAGAVQFAERLARRWGMDSVQNTPPRFLAAWIGSVNGIPVQLVALRDQDWDIMRGAGVMVERR